jgi:chemotaxis protein histidine kinase CheA
MIRNAIDHGIEKPDDRIAANKPKQGQLRLSASQRSGSIVIEIADDGAGLNRSRIHDIAIEKGLVSPDASLSDQEIDHLLFAPGFSTAAEVTNLSAWMSSKRQLRRSAVASRSIPILVLAQHFQSPCPSPWRSWMA